MTRSRAVRARRWMSAIQDAALVIFVVDITSGVAPLDQEVAKLLARQRKKVLVAANKADHDRARVRPREFETLGFPAFSVSALHGRGVDTLMQSALAELPPPEKYLRKAPSRVAIVGRPNVGKSFLHQSTARKRAGDRVGSARHNAGIASKYLFRSALEIPPRHYMLIDTAGMRKVGKVHGSGGALQRVPRGAEYRARGHRRADAGRGTGPTVQDKKSRQKFSTRKRVAC